MPRSVNHVASKARRKKTLKLAKGYFGRRKNVWTVAKNAVEKGLTYAYRDRRAKKREFRSLWIVRINAACRLNGISYSQFMGKLAKSDLNINRKILADLAMNDAEAFKAVFEQVMSSKPKAEAKPAAKKTPKARVEEVETAPEVAAEVPAEPVAEAGN
jgi:large subunit ribosomal protein L20